MPEYLDIKYISPVSNYKFDKNKLYILALFITSSDHIVKLYKTIIKDITNINNVIRGFPISKSIIVPPSLFKNTIIAKLFSYDEHITSMDLLFTGTIDLDSLESGNINYIEMDRTLKRHIQYETEEDFLNELFFIYECGKTKDKVFLYFGRRTSTEMPIMIPSEIKFDDKKKLWFYDRYNNMVIKENVPVYVGDLDGLSVAGIHYRHSNSFVNEFIKKRNNNDGYVKFIETYQKDDRYTINTNNSNSLKLSLSKQINHGFRPQHYDPYNNNVLTSPVDGKIRSFKINKSTELIIGSKLYQAKNMVSKSFQYEGGYGFVSRVSPINYQRVNVPYPAYLREIGIFGGTKGRPYMISMRFESTYYMPTDVAERDTLSAIYGHTRYGGAGVGLGLREFPETKEPQPEIILIYSVVILTNSYQDAIEFTNEKLEGIEKHVGDDKNIIVLPHWYEQGEELCKLTYGFSHVVFLTNRSIDFASDIDYYTEKKIDSFVKARDLVGTLN
jgi:hypothetical protein